MLLALFEAIDAFLDLGELADRFGLRLLGAVQPLGDFAELRGRVALRAGDAGLERRKLGGELRHAVLQGAVGVGGHHVGRRRGIARQVEVAAAPATAPSATAKTIAAAIGA